MGFIETILIYFPTFIRCYILWRLMTSVLKPINDKLILGAVCTLQILLIIQKHIQTNLPLFGEYHVITYLIILLYTFACFYFLSGNNTIERIVWWAIYTFSLLATDLITVLFLHAMIKVQASDIYGNGDPFSLVFISIGKIFLCFLIEVLINKRKGRFIIGISYIRELTILFMFNIILVLGVVFVCYSKQNIVQRIDHIVIIFLILVFMITSNTIILIFRIEKKSNEELETRLKIQQMQMELKQNNDMVDITDKLRKLRHDMNNHIGIMKALIKTEKFNDLEEYVDQIYEDVEIANDIVIMENKVVSVLLNVKKAVAKQKNIEFTSIIATQDFKMQNKDICSLLGNILDNAIEAAEKARSKKFIQLTIQTTEQGNIINCENTFGVKPIMKKGRFLTNKENNQIHGIGTENIKDIVTKYNGEIDFSYDDEMFNIRIVIPM